MAASSSTMRGVLRAVVNTEESNAGGTGAYTASLPARRLAADVLCASAQPALSPYSAGPCPPSPAYPSSACSRPPHPVRLGFVVWPRVARTAHREWGDL